MAANTGKRASATKSTATKTATKTAKATSTAKVAEDEIKETKVTMKVTEARKYTSEDLNLEIPCYNNTRGKLIYVSPNGAIVEEWQDTNDVAYLTLRDLQSMVRSDRKFFEENWLRIDDWSVLEFLRIDRYYQDAIYADDIDAFFTMKPDELEEKLVNIKPTTRSFIISQARKKIESGEIDSLKIVTVIEKALNCDLIEK